MRKIGGNARAWLLAAGLFGASRVAAAQVPHVTNECPRLSPADYDELDARLLLLLQRAAPNQPPTIVCDGGAAFLEWRGERARLPEQEPLADEAVATLEAWLEPKRASIAAEPRSQDDVAGPRPPRSRRATSGGSGVALGFETEPASGTLHQTLGPIFDFGIPVGPLQLGTREAFRFTLGGRQASLFGLQALLSYGAPFDPDASWGAALRAGGECLVAYPPGGKAQTSCLPAFGGGLRLARSFGTLGLWMGVDLNLRTGSLHLTLQRERVEVAPLSASMSIGMVVGGGRKNR